MNKADNLKNENMPGYQSELASTNLTDANDFSK
jgi:hypothetical protein